MNELDSYIMKCARAYAKKHPEKRVTARTTIDVPIEECAYCESCQPISDIPFGLKVNISGNKLVVEDGDSLTSVDINYCPICGKPL